VAVFQSALAARMVSSVPQLEVAEYDVARDKARHVDGVFRRTERGSVGEFELFEVKHGELVAHRGREHVNALVDTVEPRGLTAEYPPCLGVENDLEVHHRGAGVVPGMARGMHVHGAVRNTRSDELPLCRTRTARDHVEDLDDRRALRRVVLGVAPANALSCDASLSVRGPRERSQPRARQHRVGGFDGIARCPNMRVRGAHVGVDDNATALTEFEPGLARERCVGSHTGRQDHEIGVQHRVIGELDIETAGSLAHSGSARLEVHGDTTTAQVRLDGHR
jgi:hypothetical protein